MRILVVSQYFHPEGFRINDLVGYLRERGHDVEVLTGMPNYPAGRFFPGYGFFKKWFEVIKGTPVFRVPLWPRKEGGAINLSLNYLSFVFSSLLFGLPRLRGGYDCSFAFAVSPITSVLPAIVYKWVTGTPVVIWVQDLWPESVSAVGAIRNRRMLGWLEKLVRFIYKNSDLILIQSEAFRPNVTSLADDPAKIHYFPNWAEDLYTPIAANAVKGPAKDLPSGFKVIFAGNVGKAQALPTLIAAASRVNTVLEGRPDIHWIVLGDGSERESAEHMVREEGLQSTFHFLGRLPTELMPEYFSMADALVVTLKSEPIFALTIPSKVQSYFACARPVIAALDGEGQRVVRESGAGLVGASGDAEQLAQNVLRLYRMSREERTQMGHRGLEYYQQNFDRKRLVESLERMLRRLAPRTSLV